MIVYIVKNESGRLAKINGYGDISWTSDRNAAVYWLDRPDAEVFRDKYAPKASIEPVEVS